MSRLPTGTVTFLFTDIEGSTRLLQRLGEDYARVLGEHQALLRAAFDAHGGVEVDTQGDSFFVAFSVGARGRGRCRRRHARTGRARVAGGHHAACAHGAAYVAALNWWATGYVGPGRPPRRAHRRRGAWRPGAALGGHARAERGRPAGGRHRCATWARTASRTSRSPSASLQLVLAGLPAEFPPLKTLDAHPHNLPLQPTPLLGREEQLAALVALLAPGGRAAGDAHRAGWHRQDAPGHSGGRRAGGRVSRRCLVRRGSRALIDPELVVPTIAQTLGLREAGRPADRRDSCSELPG